VLLGHISSAVGSASRLGVSVLCRLSLWHPGPARLACRKCYTLVFLLFFGPPFNKRVAGSSLHLWGRINKAHTLVFAYRF
jgi:hypothetical protein